MEMEVKMSMKQLQTNRSGVLVALGVGIVAVLGALLIAVGASAKPQQFESGQYTTTILNSDLPEGYPPEFAPLTVGSYVISFTENGDYVVLKEGAEVILGRYTANPARLVMTDESGPFSCFEPGTETGVYEWSQANNMLTLTPTSDKCIARVTVLAAKPWAKQ